MLSYTFIMYYVWLLTPDTESFLKLEKLKFVFHKNLHSCFLYFMFQIKDQVYQIWCLYLLVLQTSYYVLPDRYILNIRETIFSFLRCFCGKIHSARNDLQLTAGYLIYWKIKNNISSNVIPQRCRVIVAKYSYRDIEFEKRYNSC